MINGPREYIPPVEIDILEKRNAIPLDEKFLLSIYFLLF